MTSGLLCARTTARLLPTLCLLGYLAAPALADSTLVFPQFVTGGGYISVVTLVNPGTTAATTGTLSFFNQGGSPRSVAIDGQPTGTNISGIRIPPGGTATLTTSPSGNLAVGMAKFVSDNPAGGVVRFVFSGGQVGVLSATPQTVGTLVLNTSGGNDTGIAIANPGADPINIRLTHLDEAGRTIEAIDPPELNPLPPNGQIAKFVTQFTFTQIANRNTGSVQIRVKESGAFSALALLLKDGALSSTAVVRSQAAGTFAPTFNGTYTGTWSNGRHSTTGTITLDASVSTATQTAVINLTMTGPVLGRYSGASVSMVGAYDIGSFTATGTSGLFGPANMTVNSDGTFAFVASAMPVGATYDPSTYPTAFRMTGLGKADQITGEYRVNYLDGGSGLGTILLRQGSIRMQ